jgi:hypothetical protein
MKYSIGIKLFIFQKKSVRRVVWLSPFHRGGRDEAVYTALLVPCLLFLAGVAGAQEERQAGADHPGVSISGRVVGTTGLRVVMYLGRDTEFGFESGSNRRGRMAPSTSRRCPGV